MSYDYMDDFKMSLFKYRIKIFIQQALMVLLKI